MPQSAFILFSCVQRWTQENSIIGPAVTVVADGSCYRYLRKKICGGSTQSIPINPNQSQPIPTNPNQSQPIPTNPNQSQPIPINPNQSQPIPINPNQSQPIPINPNQSQSIPINPNQSRSIPINPNQSQPIPINPNQSQPIPTNPNQSQLIPLRQLLQHASCSRPVASPLLHPCPAALQLRMSAPNMQRGRVSAVWIATHCRQPVALSE
eukprot:SAG31_NODE_5091_length_2748_cov_16.044923_4_plen_209_part_00